MLPQFASSIYDTAVDRAFSQLMYRSARTAMLLVWYIDTNDWPVPVEEWFVGASDIWIDASREASSVT